MMNLLAMIVCAIFAIFQGFEGNVGLCLLECVFALLNLPFVIKWVKDRLK